MNIINDLKDQLLNYYDNIIVFLPKMVLGLVLAYIIYRILKIFEKRTHKYLDTRTEDKLMVNFFDGLMHVTIIIISIFIFLYMIGQTGLASGILGAATISSVVIGFAFKDIAENFLAGVIMAFSRPFRIGDYVQTGAVEGNIVEMSIRETHLKTADGKDVYVPNGQIIKNPLYNYTIDGYLRGNFTVGVAYDSDVEAVRKTILDVVRSVPGVLLEDKLPRTHVTKLNTNTVDIEVHYWVNTFDKRYSGLEVKSQAQAKILKTLTDAKVGLPATIIELIDLTAKSEK
ncbi:MAG: small conductance mechanosensitive channel [Saprospiraceae bacterium]|jgi:small conductance mechanosensitive channel